MEREELLMVPGPVSLTHEVLRELSRPILPHFGMEWLDLYGETLTLLKRIFRTSGDAFVLVGSGSAAIEACLSSAMRRCERTVVGLNGFFGQRLLEMARSYDPTVVAVEADERQPLDPDQVRHVFEREGNVDFFACVHGETSGGILNPIEEIASVCAEFDVRLMIDAVSSLGGETVDMDGWGIDLCASAAQKCLEAPPGLSVVGISEPTADWIRTRKAHKPGGWYLDLGVWMWHAEHWRDWHPQPITHSVNGLNALRKSLKQILDEGLEERVKRHQLCAKAVREGIQGMGLEVVGNPDYLMNVVTNVACKGIAPQEIVDDLLRLYGIRLIGGMGAFEGKTFRIGHGGLQATRRNLVPTLFGIEEVLRRKGLKVPPGSSLVGIEGLPM